MEKRNLVVIGVVIGIIIIIATITTSINLKQKEVINRYETIPEKPADFDAYTRDIWSGAYLDLCEVGEDYWQQPEFYNGDSSINGDKGSWEIARKAFYDNPDYSRWGVYGQGNIPKEISYSFTNLKEGDEFTLCSFFHNGFGIWTYQGFKLIPLENEYFDVEITPNQLTLSPTFPSFTKDWTQKVQVTIRVKKPIPSGQYELGFDVTEPDPEYSRLKTKETLQMYINKDLYKEECIRFLKDEERCNYLVNNREKKYVAGGIYKTTEPLLKVKIIVK